MKFYTDPEFFFNIWCNELIKDNETRKVEKKRRKTKAVGWERGRVSRWSITQNFNMKLA